MAAASSLLLLLSARDRARHCAVPLSPPRVGMSDASQWSGRTAAGAAGVSVSGECVPDADEPGSASHTHRTAATDGSSLDDGPPALPADDADAFYSASAPASSKASRRNSLQPPPPISTGPLVNPFAPGYALAAATATTTEAELVPVDSSSAQSGAAAAAATSASVASSGPAAVAAPPAEVLARSPSSQASPNTLRQRSQSVVALPSQLERKQLWLKKAKYAAAQPAMIPTGKRSGFCCF